MKNKRFVAYYYCNGIDFSLGISINFSNPNLEIHIPTGFIRIGWVHRFQPSPPLGERAGNRFLYRAFGYNINY